LRQLYSYENLGFDAHLICENAFWCQLYENNSQTTALIIFTWTCKNVFIWNTKQNWFCCNV